MHQNAKVAPKVSSGAMFKKSTSQRLQLARFFCRKLRIICFASTNSKDHDGQWALGFQWQSKWRKDIAIGKHVGNAPGFQAASVTGHRHECIQCIGQTGQTHPSWSCSNVMPRSCQGSNGTWWCSQQLWHHWNNNYQKDSMSACSAACVHSVVELSFPQGLFQSAVKLASGNFSFHTKNHSW